jgi:hypothetical protein
MTHNMMWMTYFYKIFHGQIKHILHVRACSTPTTVTSEHRIIPMLSADMVKKSTSAS